MDSTFDGYGAEGRAFGTKGFYCKKNDCAPGYKKIVGHPFAGSSCETPGLTCHQNSDITSEQCAGLCMITGGCIAYTQEFDHGWCHLIDSTYRDGFVADENAFGTEGFYCKKMDCMPGYKKIVGHPFAGSSCATPGLTCHQNSDITSQQCAGLCMITGGCIAYTTEFDQGG